MTAVDGEVFDLLGSSTSTRSVPTPSRDGETFDFSPDTDLRAPPTARRDGETFDFSPDTDLRVRSTARRDGTTFDLVGTASSSSRAFGAKREGTLFPLATFWFTARTAPAPRREGQTFFIGGGGPAPTPTYYALAAIDTGVGRRYWSSLTLDFASAPTPVGSWVTASLTILGEWT